MNEITEYVSYPPQTSRIIMEQAQEAGLPLSLFTKTLTMKGLQWFLADHELWTDHSLLTAEIFVLAEKMKLVSEGREASNPRSGG